MKVPARIVRNAPMTLADAIAACGSDYKGRSMKVSALSCALSRLLMTLAGVIAACGSDYKGRSMKVPARIVRNAPALDDSGRRDRSLRQRLQGPVDEGFGRIVRNASAPDDSGRRDRSLRLQGPVDEGFGRIVRNAPTLDDSGRRDRSLRQRLQRSNLPSQGPGIKSAASRSIPWPGVGTRCKVGA